VKKEIETIIYNDMIPLKDESISNAICVFKLERIPLRLIKNYSWKSNEFSKTREFVIVFRSKNSIYGLIHKLIN